MAGELYFHSWVAARRIMDVFTENKDRVEIYEDRIEKKNRKSNWSNLTIHHINNSY